MANRIGVLGYRFQRDVTLDAASVPAGTTQAEIFAVPGLKQSGGPVIVNKPTNEAGLVLQSAYVPADDELALVFQNASGDAINPALQVYKVVQL